jgi:hypothetical protein
MTTLAANTPRAFELGDYYDYPAINADIVYEGAAIGAVDATGLARPLVGGDRFLGFCYGRADNAAGAASAINVRALSRGEIQLTVSGAVVTDIGQPVYATDDNTFVFNPVGASYIGKIVRWVAADTVIVQFDAILGNDPYGSGEERETVSANKTLDVQDTGKTFFVDTDAVVITMPTPATGLRKVRIVNIAPFGTALISVNPDTGVKVMGPDIAGTNDKDLQNTKATQRRGDYVVLSDDIATGYLAHAIKGTWTTEA